ncbi:diacylglycerol acyltransferase type 2A [Umbelopsis sp. PMI_123]|nr:diacylglycerol acyltransferase type 2A [Umbelopsis sp. PMI_123]
MATKDQNLQQKAKRSLETIPAPRYAPLRVPLKRRLQTLAVLLWCSMMPICMFIFFFLCSIPILLWFPIIMYLTWILVWDKAPENGGRSIRWLRNAFWWKLFADYFPAHIVKEEDLDPSKNYIFGYHPHGIISMGSFCTFSTNATGFDDLFPGIRPSLLTLTSNFNIPIYRDYLMACGLCSVSKTSCQNILAKGGPGRSIAIVVGGASESLNARPGVMDLVLKRRFGFIKIAIQTGASLVPTVSFGENDLYEQVESNENSKLHRWQKKIQHALGFTMPLFHGRGVFNYDIGLLPHRHPIYTIVGKPIPVPSVKDGRTKDEIVKELHDTYMQAVQDIYDRYKDIYAKDRVKELEFVE